MDTRRPKLEEEELPGVGYLSSRKIKALLETVAPISSVPFCSERCPFFSELLATLLINQWRE